MRVQNLANAAHIDQPVVITKRKLPAGWAYN